MFKESGYTGSMLENESFDSVEKEKYPDNEKKHYIDFKRAMDLVKQHQPYEDPSDPDPRFSNDLHAQVAELLNLDDYNDLRLYTAVGSHLDKFHSTDAFFEYDINGKTIYVTLDITKNKQKGTEYRANVVFQMPPEGLDPGLEEDKEAYKEKINEVAERIVEQIKIIYDKIFKEE